MTSDEWRVASSRIGRIVTLPPWLTLEHVWLPYTQMKGAVDAVGLRGRFVERGLWIKPFGDVIYLTPPLVIDAGDLSALTRGIYEVLSER